MDCTTVHELFTMCRESSVVHLVCCRNQWCGAGAGHFGPPGPDGAVFSMTAPAPGSPLKEKFSVIQERK